MNTSWTVPFVVRGFETLPAREMLGGTAYAYRIGKLSVLLTVEDHEAFEPGAGVWAHCSLARPDRDPTWNEIKLVRDRFFGREAVAAQVLAPASRWLNVHEHCFHLFMRLDAPTFPSSLYEQAGADGSRYGKRALLPAAGRP